MAFLELFSSAVFAGLAGIDATRRGQSWPLPVLGVGAVALVASLGVTAGDGVLLTAYATVNGTPMVVVTPLELLGLTVAAAALVSGAVLSGYGVLTRRRGPA